MVIAIIVGLIIAVALYSFVPVIGYQIASSTSVPTTSPWGVVATAGTNATTLWSSTSGLPVIMIIAIVIGGAIAIFMGI
jgi:hypothetical protein